MLGVIMGVYKELFFSAHPSPFCVYAGVPVLLLNHVSHELETFPYQGSSADSGCHNWSAVDFRMYLNGHLVSFFEI